MLAKIPAFGELSIESDSREKPTGKFPCIQNLMPFSRYDTIVLSKADVFLKTNRKFLAYRK